MLQHARDWRVAIDETVETETSLIAFGRRDGDRVVLKVVKREGDEWNSGDVLSAFAGHGVVRVHECTAGACLAERVDPGTSLVDLARAGRDDEATDALARVIGSMTPAIIPPHCPTVQEWGRGFAWYLSSGDSQIPKTLVQQAVRIYSQLSAAQRGVRLLHGDLQHSNVLLDAGRGWLAIDPKGVVGEVEYEVGAALRNPREVPHLVGDPAVVERRVDRFVSVLNLDGARVVGWAFAQAVLSLIWTVEDGSAITAGDPSGLLVDAIRPLLRRAGF